MTLRSPPETRDLSLAAARARLRTPIHREPPLSVLVCAALCALCGLTLAAAVILGPPGTTSPQTMTGDAAAALRPGLWPVSVGTRRQP